jgi:hypothetical protein
MATRQKAKSRHQDEENSTSALRSHSSFSCSLLSFQRSAVLAASMPSRLRRSLREH